VSRWHTGRPARRRTAADRSLRTRSTGTRSSRAVLCGVDVSPPSAGRTSTAGDPIASHRTQEPAEGSTIDSPGDRRQDPCRCQACRPCASSICPEGRSPSTLLQVRDVAVCACSVSPLGHRHEPPRFQTEGVLSALRLPSSSHGRVRGGSGTASGTQRRRGGGCDRASASRPGLAPLGCPVDRFAAIPAEYPEAGHGRRRHPEP